MSIGKPTIVFVHGAFHTPESLDDLAAALKSKGYHCPNTFQLRSVDAPSNNPPGLLEDAEALRTHVVECINGTGQFERYGANDCVVVMHSYGGTVGSQALEGLGQKDRAGKKAIKRLVFIAANVPRVGDNLLDQYNSFGEAKGYGDSADNIKVDNQNFLFVAPPEAFYNDIPPERRKELYKKLVPTGMGAFTTPLTAAAYKDISSWYLITDKDNNTIPELQDWILSQHEGVFENVEHIHGGHCCVISMPNEVADFIDRAATT